VKSGSQMSSVRLGVLAVAVFLTTRVATLAAVWVRAHQERHSVLNVLTKADALQYLRLAAKGYDAAPAIGPGGAYVKPPNFVFFPLYPWTIRAFSWAVDPRIAGIAAALLAGVMAAWLMAQWARDGAGGPAGALTVVGIWSLWPSSVVLSMAYSEALFSAAVAGCLLAMQRRRWVWAALACTIAGLTRPAAAALLVAVVVALLTTPRPRPSPARIAGITSLAAAGLIVSLGHVSIVTGRLDGWLWTQRTAWRSGFDAGSTMRTLMHSVLTGGTYAHVPAYVVATVTVLAAAVLVVLMFVGRLPAREITYGVLAFVMGVGGANYVHCKPRFLLVDLPLFTVPGRWLGRLKWPVLAVVAAVALGASVYWSVFLLTQWKYSI